MSDDVKIPDDVIDPIDATGVAIGELKPCPFCGHPPISGGRGDIPREVPFVFCGNDDCPGQGPSLTGKDGWDSMVARWNTRSGSQGVVDDAMVSIAVAGFNAARGSPHHVHLIGNHFEYEQMRAGLLAVMGGRSDGWISVKERMPEVGVHVFVHGGIAKWCGKRWKSLMSGYPISWEVTHWMPLPPPPTTISEERAP